MLNWSSHKTPCLLIPHTSYNKQYHALPLLMLQSQIEKYHEVANAVSRTVSWFNYYITKAAFIQLLKKKKKKNSHVLNAVIIVMFSWEYQISSATLDEHSVMVMWKVTWETSQIEETVIAVDECYNALHDFHGYHCLLVQIHSAIITLWDQCSSYGFLWMTNYSCGICWISCSMLGKFLLT